MPQHLCCNAPLVFLHGGIFSMQGNPMKAITEDFGANDTVILQVPGAAPIPAGRTVSICILSTKGLLGYKPDFTFPLITDLETGIRYGSVMHFTDNKTPSTGPFFNRSTELSEFVKVHKEFQATVKACHVLSSMRQGNLWTQTTLVVEI